MREPVSRLLSAFYYRGHSPNLDFFQVRPEAKLIAAGKRPKVKFDEYLDMHEYQNIQTRMLGADSFPYRNITVSEGVYQSAVEALDAFFFIGMQEVYDLSVKLLLREIDMADYKVSIEKERDQSLAPRIVKEKASIKANKTLMEKARLVNSYDIKLYQLAKEKFCKTLSKYPDLLEELDVSKLSCDYM